MSDAVKRLKANKLIAGKQCGWCRSPLEIGEDAAICRECKLLHHDACWEERGGCARGLCQRTPAAGRGGSRRRLSRPRRPRHKRASRHAGKALHARVGRARKTLIVMGILVLLGMGCQMAKISKEQRDFDAKSNSPLYEITPENREMAERYLSIQRTTSIVMGLMGIAYLVLGITAASAPYGVCLTGSILLGVHVLLTLLGLLMGEGEGRGGVVVVALIVVSLMGLALSFVIGGARAGHELRRSG